MPIRHTLCLALAALALAACVYDHGSDAEAKEPMRLVLTLAFGESTRDGGATQTRADDNDKWGTQSYKWIDGEVYDANGKPYNPGEDEGTTYDNRLDISTLQVLFFDQTGHLACGVQNLRLKQKSQKNEWRYEGVINSTSGFKNNQEYKVVVVANLPRKLCQGFAYYNTLTDIVGETYRWHQPAASDPAPDTNDRIPVCGVVKQTVNLTQGARPNIDNENDGTNYLSKIFLLRAVSKIEVRLSKALIDKGYKLTKNSRLTRANALGRCFPAGFSTTDKTTSLVRKQCFNPEQSEFAGAAPKFAQDAADELTGSGTPTDKLSGQWLTWYTPELENTAGRIGALDIEVQKADGSTKTFAGAIPFQYLSDYYEVWTPSATPVAKGTPYNLHRNHEYLFTINSITQDGFRFGVTIADMEKGGDIIYEY